MSQYVDIAADIRAQIIAGTYPAGSPLPDQKTLAAAYHTSRMTLQKALNILKTEGIIYSQQGAGTYVKYNADSVANMEVGVDQYVGTTELLGTRHRLESHVIRFNLRYPTELEQEKLQVGATDVIYDIIRLREVDGAPYALEYTKMPVNVIPGIDESVLKRSVYHYIEHELGLEIGAALRQIRAARSSEDDRAYLGNAKDEPVLAVTNVVFLDDGRPFEFSTTDQKFDRSEFTVFLPGRNH